MRNLRKIIHKKGLTLIELIVSIALIGIIVVALLPIFTVGFKNIAASGVKSKEIYQAQDTTETDLMEGASISNGNLSIVFPVSPGAITISLTGEQGTNGSIQFFIPD